MSGRIESRDNTHEGLRLLLPWYVTAKLTATDHVLIERHLAHCAGCQAELAAERNLHVLVAELPATLPPDWASLERRIGSRSSSAAIAGLVASIGFWLKQAGARRVSLGWVMLPQLVAALLIALVMLPGRSPAYRTQGSASGPASANAIIMFRPETREVDIRRLLADDDARLVDGPTAAGAYLLRISPARRSATLLRLRRDHAIVLIEPIDAAS